MINIGTEKHKVFVPEDTPEIILYKNQTKERRWRDSELSRTDLLMTVSDYPDKPNLELYRQSLRDYPSQPDFPNGTRPSE